MAQALRRLARKAPEEPRIQCTAIAHLLTEEGSWAAWRRLKKGASAGGDGVTATASATDLGANLRALHARGKANQDRPPPGRRVPSPQEGGQARPRGVPAREDKLVQGAVRRGLEASSEQDVLPCAEGFRPGRSPQQARAAGDQALSRQKVDVVRDVDIARCFDSMEHTGVLRFVQHRVQEGSLLRRLRRGVRAGSLAAGALRLAETGTRKGA